MILYKNIPTPNNTESCKIILCRTQLHHKNVQRESINPGLNLTKIHQLSVQKTQENQDSSQNYIPINKYNLNSPTTNPKTTRQQQHNQPKTHQPLNQKLQKLKIMETQKPKPSNQITP